MALVVANVRGPYKLILKRDKITVIDGTPVKEAAIVVAFGNTGKAWVDDEEKLEMIRKTSQFKSGIVKIYDKAPPDEPKDQPGSQGKYSKGPVTTRHIKGK